MQIVVETARNRPWLCQVNPNWSIYPALPGTGKLVEKYGDRLICARYRYDSKRKKRTTTVGLVESENDWLEARIKSPETKLCIYELLTVKRAWPELRNRGISSVLAWALL